MVDAILGSSSKMGGDRDSERGSVNGDAMEYAEKKSLSNYFVKKQHSYKSGGSGGGGSVVTSLSDLERIEKIMN